MQGASDMQNTFNMMEATSYYFNYALVILKFSFLMS